MFKKLLIFWYVWYKYFSSLVTFGHCFDVGFFPLKSLSIYWYEILTFASVTDFRFRVF